MKKSVAIFDMDGTLVDSMYQWSCVPAGTLFQFGYQMTDEDEREVRRLGFYKSPGYLIDRYDLPCTQEEFIERGYLMMQEQYRQFILMRPNAKRYLQRLHEKGIRTAVLTASAGVFVDIMTEKFGLEGLIDAAFCAHDLGIEKSKPDIYRLLFDTLGCTGEECVMFEDSAYALHTARELGIDGVGVLDPVRPGQHDALGQAAVRCVREYGELLENDIFD